MSTDMSTQSVNAAASLPRDLAIVKMENDQIFSIAAAHPRDMVKIQQHLEEMIVSFPQFADDAIYEKPVGKDDAGVMKYARGLSVRAAETLAEVYGFNRIHTDVECLTDGRVKVYASFTDYQRGRTWEDATIVSPFYKSKGGATARHPEDRFLNVIVKSEKSKLVREVINRSINQALKAWFENRCELQLSKTLDDVAIQKILHGFATYKLDREKVEAIVGRPIAMGWTVQDKVRLSGVWNALKNGETSVAELLGTEEPATSPDTKRLPQSGTVDALKNPKGQAEERPHSKATDPAQANDATPKSEPSASDVVPAGSYYDWARWQQKLKECVSLARLEDLSLLIKSLDPQHQSAAQDLLAAKSTSLESKS